LKDVILSKIRKRTARVAVFGLGHIGLPLAAVIAGTGFQVTGVDPDSKIANAVLGGRVDISEPKLNSMIKEAVEKKLLKVASDGKATVNDTEVILVCVPTPIKENKTPDLSYIEEVCRTIAHSMSNGKLVIIGSTLPPETTETFVAPLLERESGLRCGIDFWLTYCPERIAPGEALKELVENDRVIGGYNAESAEVASEFFKTFVKGNMLITDAITSEVSKLAENAFRDVNIAFANELALLCERLGVDVIDAIKLANTHPRVSIHMPGCGVGGPCLPKDPYLLLSPLRDFDSQIIEQARSVNESMPEHVAELAIEGLKKLGKPISESRITVLGTAYKGNVGDPRMSPSEHIIKKFLDLGAKVVAYDPHCSESFGAEMAGSLIEAVRGSDCVIFATDHSEFKGIDLFTLRKQMKDSPTIVDGKRIIDPFEAKRMGFRYRGVGYKAENEVQYHY